MERPVACGPRGPFRAVYGSTGSRRPSRRRPPRGARRGRADRRRRASEGRAAIPRETLTSSPPPAPDPAGAAVAGPSARPARCRRPGHRRPGRGTRARGDGADRRELGRRRRADDEARRSRRGPSRRPGGRPAGGAAPPGRRSPRSAADAQVLELGRARVRRPAQDVGEAVGALEERLDGVAPEVRVDRDRVGAQASNERDRLARGRRADVAPLRVGDDRHVGRDRGADALERRQPADPRAS